MNEYHRYRAFEFKSFRLGAGKELIYSAINKTARVVPREWISVIRACDNFATLRQHADRISSRAQVPGVDTVLSALVEAGLLISETDLVRMLAAGSHETDQPVPIGILAFPTRDRVDLLERALTSYINNTKHYGRRVSFVISDDSRNLEAECSCRQMLRELSRAHAVEIRYAGQVEKNKFAHNLALESGVSEEEIRFGLFGDDNLSFSPGACRNALLLETMGCAIVQADDDSICTLAAAPGRRAGIALKGEGDPTELWFFGSREETIASNEFCNEDFLSLHEDVLGRRVGSFLSVDGSGSATDMEDLTAAFLTAQKEYGGNIVASSLGVIGNSGMERVLYALVGESSLDRLIASVAIYREALASREVLRAAPQTTIAMRTTCMGGNLGLDNRQLLPPFMPVQRGEDTVFSLLLTTCLTGSFIGFSPWALLHDPPHANHEQVQNYTSVVQLRTNDYVSLMIASVALALRSQGQQQRLQALGQHLVDTAMLRAADFTECMRETCWRAISGYIQLLEQRLIQRRGQPEYWASDVRRLIDAFRLAATTEFCGVPADLVDGNDIDRARTLFKTVLLRYGLLLKSWPDITDGARLLQAKGTRLAEAV